MWDVEIYSSNTIWVGSLKANIIGVFVFCFLTILLHVQCSAIGQAAQTEIQAHLLYISTIKQHVIRTTLSCRQLKGLAHWYATSSMFSSNRFKSNKPFHIKVHSWLHLWQYNAGLCKYIDLLRMTLSPAVPELDECELISLIMTE